MKKELSSVYPLQYYYVVLFFVWQFKENVHLLKESLSKKRAVFNTRNRYISISTGEKFDIEQGHSTGYQARI